MHRGPIAEIDLSAIAHNLRCIQTIVNNRPIIAVVKADAYGHGAPHVSRKLHQIGIHHLAVAFTGEARELRESGIRGQILVLFDQGDVEEYFEYELVPVVSSVETARRISEEAARRAIVMGVHIKIDTGMGRLGLHGGDVVKTVAEIADLPCIEISGILSHFSEADLADGQFARKQCETFIAIVKELRTILRFPFIAHIANSAAVMSFERSHLDAVRPGLMLYGYSPFGEKTPDRRGDANEKHRNGEPELIPAMTVKARLLDIRRVPEGTPVSYGRTFVTRRPSVIGVLALGYADGYTRLFSNNAFVLVRGKKAPVVGRVCMDLTMVDLTDIPGVEQNDEVVVLGNQGDVAVTAHELAARAHTIPYEILTSLGSRARRVYVEDH